MRRRSGVPAQTALSIATKNMEPNGKVAPFIDDIKADEIEEPQTSPEMKLETLQRGVIIDNLEDRSIGYCKLIVNYPKLSFGKIKYSFIRC